ncbi:MAG: DUF1569 domain-containing protein [Bacteroidota bacterium]
MQIKIMAIQNIFSKEVTDQVIARVGKLHSESQPLWGKMNAAQMYAHCCVSYELVFEPEKHPKPGAFMKFILKLLVKPQVVTEKPYSKNSRTARAFLITDERQFELEKGRLIDFLSKTQQQGTTYFDGKESHSFGPLTLNEWNNLFYKHIDHHLQQFGV